MRIPLPHPEATIELGTHLAGLLRPGDLIILTGDLGAGKTTLTKGIAAGLDVQGAVSSPTFIIARVHPGETPLVHVDAYRLGSLAEVDDLDLDSDLTDSVTVVEWGEGLVEDLAEDRLEIAVVRPRGADDHGRYAEITAVGSRWEGVDLRALARAAG
ncbi:MAG TPA: tRNA (adenosine(37)-N6)-threonylcarbamoyltransferase complex ATPase subunit type 1 TsaE [Beutenbergiaceae bacterium]|nr:tRNA (adenosine(37)-N6)-threonylcarbamoyltransferase complex ATPase subunit type 1 TsaE [Beutenbergiaceae bacterium]